MINYYTTLNIHLSLEEYYNKGLSPLSVKNIIESLNDPMTGQKFHCRSSGFNNNWVIETRGNIEVVVSLIESELEYQLWKMGEF